MQIPCEGAGVLEASADKLEFVAVMALESLASRSMATNSIQRNRRECGLKAMMLLRPDLIEREHVYEGGKVDCKIHRCDRKVEPTVFR